ncbi:sensor domain-containing diguanylate cyclase [Paenibacillus glycanilyticus]|uniref:sensor domain-containing diguanylate cyclase n=1 Tax=Paenibacillus glycanilyticus TaxID=126569 RepID=UPI00190FC5B3|nr:GGDEF domain-containing protein [Paenibacillus glycanilyticus]
MHSEWIAYIAIAFILVALNLYICFYVFAVGSITPSCLFKTIPIPMEAIFHSMNDGVLVLDNSFRLIEFNQASQKMFPQLNKKMFGNDFSKLWKELFGLDFPFPLITAAQSMQLRLTPGDNMERTYQVRTSLLQHANNRKGLLLIFTDITESKRLQTQLEHLAYYDELTGINNRRAFFQQCNQLFTEAKQHGEAFTVILMDIDYYKKVNDTYGHYAGDLLLVHIVRACQTQLQAGELFARYGGEEFVFARKSCTAAEGEALANRLRVIAAKPIATSEGMISVTVSLGVAEATKGGEETLSQLLNKADQALYAAKQQGRNRVCVYKESLFALGNNLLERQNDPRIEHDYPFLEWKTRSLQRM